MKRFLFFVLMCLVVQFGWGQNATDVPSTMLSPLVGVITYQYPPTNCPWMGATTWGFCQHQTGGHYSTGGINQANDTYAWDCNLSSNLDAGKDVYPVEDGEISHLSGWSGSSYGQLLIKHVTNGKTWYSGYLHMSNITNKKLTAGTFVSKYEVIGQVDDISPSTSISEHLHFAVYYKNSSNKLISVDRTFIERLSASNIYAPNQSLAIYCGSTSSPRDFELFFTKDQVNNETPNVVINIMVGGQSINGTTALSPMPNWSNNVFELRALPNSNAFSSLSNNTAYDISFDVVTTQGNTYHFYGLSQAYLKAETSLNGSLGSGSEWMKPYVQKGLKWGLFKGTGGVSSTTFGANNNLTREQAASVIVSAAIYSHAPSRLIDASNPNNDFTDVGQGSYSYAYVHTLKNWGVISASSSFSPTTAITMKEFVRWLDLALQFDPFDVAPNGVMAAFQSRIVLNVSGSNYQTSMYRLMNIVQQSENLNNYQYEPVLSAVDFSLLQGASALTGNITVDGTATVTRGKMSKILTNAFRAAYAKYNNNAYPYKTVPNGNNNGGGYSTLSLSDVTIIGDKFENADNTLSSTPTNIPTIAFTCPSGGSLPISYPSDNDGSGNPQHFYWSMEKNGATLTSNTTTHRNITFTAPTVTSTTVWNLYSYVADNKGKAYEYLITITVNPTTIPTPTTPTLQATNITFSNIGTGSVDVSWNRGNGAYCILTCTDANYNSNDPVNGIVYNANSDYTVAPLTDPGDDSRVVYAGSSNNIAISGLQAGTSYRFKVYEYNVATGNYALYNYNSVPNNTVSTNQIQLPPTTVSMTWSPAMPFTENTTINFTGVATNYSSLTWSVTGNATRLVKY